MPAPSLCTVSGVMLGPDGTALSGGSVKVYNTTAFTDGSGNYFPPGLLASTTTASDGTWSLALVQTQALGHSLTFQFDYPLGNSQSRSQKYAAVIPSTSTATFSSIVNLANGQAIISYAYTTDGLPEGVTNLYHTNARTLASTLTGYVAGAGTVAATDTVLSALEKLDGNDQLKIPLSQRGANSGVATLDSGGKVPLAQLPASLMEYQGTWNATTNTPALADGTGTSGFFYRVNVGGTINLGSGSQTFVVGDWVMYNGSIWQLAHAGADVVISVAGKTGAVTLAAADVSGVLASANNLSDLANATTARTNLGLGTAATQNTSAFLQPANNLSDVGTASTAFNNISGLTTLGDIIYGGASGTRSRLAGNTTATKNFLVQTGTGTGSAAPSWGTIAAADVPTLNQNTTGTASNVTGTVAIANGGTGQTTQQAAIDALLPSQTSNSGKFLTTNGTTSSWAAPGSTALSVVTKTANYTLATSDDVVLANPSGAFTLTLPTAVGNTGKVFRLVKIANDFSNVVTIATTSAQTIGGNSSVSLNTFNEAWTLVSDGSNWQIVDHRESTPLTAYTPTFTGFGTVTTQSFFWRRVGDAVEIEGHFTIAGTAAVQEKVSLPAGLSASASVSTRDIGGLYTLSRSGGTASSHGGSIIFEPSSTTFSFSGSGVFGNTTVDAGLEDSSGTGWTTGDILYITAKIPVSGWYN